MAARSRPGLAGRLAGMAALTALAWLALAAELAPLARGAWPLPGPDAVFCVAAFWVVRRPAEAPAFALFLLGLARDLVTGGPLGAGALGLLAATEVLRRNGAALRRRSFAVEWAAVAAAGALALALPAALVAASFAAAPEAGALAARAAATALAYAPLALLLRHGLRLAAQCDPAEGDSMFARRVP